MKRSGLLVALIFVALSGSTASAASFPWVWHAAGRIDSAGPVGLACPSNVLCVAVDRHGKVIRSLRPAGGAATFSTTDIPGGPSFTAVACASSSLCIAGDTVGRIWTFSNPSAGVGSPQVAAVDPGIGIASITCPAASVCVAGAGEDILVSTDPSAGAGSWKKISGVDDFVDYECAKYQSAPNCGVPIDWVSCSSSSYCVATDGEGGSVTGDPLSGSFPPQYGTVGSFISGAACLPGGPCVSECAVAEGANPCPGPDYAATDLCGTTPQCYELTLQALTGLFCPMRSLCYATGQTGSLLVSIDPAGGASTWRTVIAASNGDHPPPALQAVACPASGLCVAVNAAGDLRLGAPPPNASELKILLARLLPATGPAARINQLLTTRRYRYSISSPTASLATIRWTVRHPVGRHARTVLIARGMARFTAAGTKRVIITLTRAGHALLHASNRIRLSATAALTGASSHTIHASSSFTLTG